MQREREREREGERERGFKEGSLIFSNFQVSGVTNFIPNQFSICQNYGISNPTSL